MKEMFTLIILLWAGLQLPAQGGCTVKKEDFKPVIATLNPFFTDHQWDSYRHLEKARLDVNRSLLITQAGCRRHHVTMILSIKPEALPGTVTREAFFIQEALKTMHMVYWEKKNYTLFKSKFEENFIAGLKKNGTGTEFNFPIGTSTFICSVRMDAKMGARITIEQATYIFAETLLKKKGLTPRKEDDGWFKKE